MRLFYASVNYQEWHNGDLVKILAFSHPGYVSAAGGSQPDSGDPRFFPAGAALRRIFIAGKLVRCPQLAASASLDHASPLVWADAGKLATRQGSAPGEMGQHRRDGRLGNGYDINGVAFSQRDNHYCLHVGSAALALAKTRNLVLADLQQRGILRLYFDARSEYVSSH